MTDRSGFGGAHRAEGGETRGIIWNINSMSKPNIRKYTNVFFLEKHDRTKPAISGDLITKHYILLNTFIFYLLCLRLCFK